VNIQPIGYRVLVKPDSEEEISPGGIVLPDYSKKKPQEGTVLAVGTDRLLDSGECQVIPVKVGDRIILAKYGGAEIEIEREEYLILDVDSILGVITRD